MRVDHLLVQLGHKQAQIIRTSESPSFSPIHSLLPWIMMRSTLCFTTSSGRFVAVSLCDPIRISHYYGADPSRCLVQALGGEHTRGCLLKGRSRTLPCLPL